MKELQQRIEGVQGIHAVDRTAFQAKLTTATAAASEADATTRQAEEISREIEGRNAKKQSDLTVALDEAQQSFDQAEAAHHAPLSAAQKIAHDLLGLPLTGVVEADRKSVAEAIPRRIVGHRGYKPQVADLFLQGKAPEEVRQGLVPAPGPLTLTPPELMKLPERVEVAAFVPPTATPFVPRPKPESLPISWLMIMLDIVAGFFLGIGLMAATGLLQERTFFQGPTQALTALLVGGGIMIGFAFLTKPVFREGFKKKIPVVWPWVVFMAMVVAELSGAYRLITILEANRRVLTDSATAGFGPDLLIKLVVAGTIPFIFSFLVIMTTRDAARRDAEAEQAVDDYNESEPLKLAEKHVLETEDAKAAHEKATEEAEAQYQLRLAEVTAFNANAQAVAERANELAQAAHREQLKQHEEAKLSSVLADQLAALKVDVANFKLGNITSLEELEHLLAQVEQAEPALRQAEMALAAAKSAQASFVPETSSEEWKEQVRRLREQASQLEAEVRNWLDQVAPPEATPPATGDDQP